MNEPLLPFSLKSYIFLVLKIENRWWRIRVVGRKERPTMKTSSTVATVSSSTSRQQRCHYEYSISYYNVAHDGWKYLNGSIMKPKGQEKEKKKTKARGAVQQKQQASMNDSSSLRGVTCPQRLYHFVAKRSGYMPYCLLASCDFLQAARHFSRVLATEQCPPYQFTNPRGRKGSATVRTFCS